MKRLRFLVMAALAAVAMLGLAAPAQAQFAVRATDATGATVFFTVFDQGPGDLNPAVNQITVVSGAAGVPLIPGFNANIDTALTNVPGTVDFALLDLTFTLQTGPTGGGTVRIETSATGFINPGPALNPLTLTSSIGGTVTGGTVTGQQWATQPSTLFGLGPITPGPQGPFTGAFANVASVSFNATGTYSLTDRVTVTLGPNGIATGNLESRVTGIPAPAGLVLALGGVPVLGVGALLRRRFGKKA